MLNFQNPSCKTLNMKYLTALKSCRKDLEIFQKLLTRAKTQTIDSGRHGSLVTFNYKDN